MRATAMTVPWAVARGSVKDSWARHHALEGEGAADHVDEEEGREGVKVRLENPSAAWMSSETVKRAAPT